MCESSKIVPTVNGELLSAGAALVEALASRLLARPLRRQLVGIVATAVRADRAVGPAQRFKHRSGRVLIAEVLREARKRSGLLRHVSSLRAGFDTSRHTPKSLTPYDLGWADVCICSAKKETAPRAAEARPNQAGQISTGRSNLLHLQASPGIKPTNSSRARPFRVSRSSRLQGVSREVIGFVKGSIAGGNWAFHKPSPSSLCSTNAS
jgi:hypothetical protein